jgi:hypothetical protein
MYTEENVWLSFRLSIDHEVLIITVVRNAMLILDILKCNDIGDCAATVPDLIPVARPCAFPLH